MKRYQEVPEGTPEGMEVRRIARMQESGTEPFSNGMVAHDSMSGGFNPYIAELAPISEPAEVTDTQLVDWIAARLLDEWIFEATRWDTENCKPMFHIYSENEKALNGPHWHAETLRDVAIAAMKESK